MRISDALGNYRTLTILDGEWMLSPADMQEGGATKKGPAAKWIGTGETAISFKVVGKGSAVQENLLPGTGKEMVSMHHCDSFKKCPQVHAKHYCAKQNQPELILDAANSNETVIVMTCDTSTPLCRSAEGHVHMIKHELSQDNNHLKTTYTIYSDGKFEKNSILSLRQKAIIVCIGLNRRRPSGPFPFVLSVRKRPDFPVHTSATRRFHAAVNGRVMANTGSTGCVAGIGACTNIIDLFPAIRAVRAGDVPAPILQHPSLWISGHRMSCR